MFLTKLRLERIESLTGSGRGTWELIEDLFYASDVEGVGVLRVPRGFITDLASVPRLPWAYWAVGGLGHEAAVVHDWLYTTHQTSRATADKVLREAAQVAGMSAWRAWVMYLGVRAGGMLAWGSAGPRQRIEIPRGEYVE